MHLQASFLTNQKEEEEEECLWIDFQCLSYQIQSPGTRLQTGKLHSFSVLYYPGPGLYPCMYITLSK